MEVKKILFYFAFRKYEQLSTCDRAVESQDSGLREWLAEEKGQND